MTSQNIPNKILDWYDNNKRDLPWRKKVSRTQKEYFTLVSEFMLQQTQVKTVIPYFENFISKIPDLKSLSIVRDAKLMKCWEGLGYYSRARNLKNTKTKFFIISFTSDWLYPTSENKEIVIALNAIGADVGFVEIKTDKGHDSFLLDVPDFLSTIKNYLNTTYSNINERRI